VEKINFFGEDVEFDHIGIAVKSIDEPYSKDKICDPIQRVCVAFINIHGCKAELIEPIDENSPISGMLKKGICMYHLCYKVPDLDSALDIARQNGFLCLSEPVEAVAFENRKIAWVFNRSYGIFELLESKIKSKIPGQQ